MPSHSVLVSLERLDAMHAPGERVDAAHITVLEAYVEGAPPRARAQRPRYSTGDEERGERRRRESRSATVGAITKPLTKLFGEGVVVSSCLEGE